MRYFREVLTGEVYTEPELRRMWEALPEKICDTWEEELERATTWWEEELAELDLTPPQVTELWERILGADEEELDTIEEELEDESPMLDWIYYRRYKLKEELA